MAVKFSEFTIGAINADLELVGFNSATPNNVQVSYTDIKTDILASAITGSGASGQVAYWNGTNSVTGSSNLTYSGGYLTNTNTATDSAILIIRPNQTTYQSFIGVGTVGAYSPSNLFWSFGLVVGNQDFNIQSYNGTTVSSRIKIYASTGNISLNAGANSDGGQRLQVYGDAFIKGSDTSPSTVALTIQNSGGIDLFKVFNNGQIYIPQPSSTVLYLNQIGGYSTDRIAFGRLISGSGISGMNASAHVEIVSTTQGFLGPRMTTTQKNTIASPAAGLQVYDTTLNQMSYYNGTTWVNF